MRQISLGRRARHVWLHRWALAALALIVALAIPTATSAHPLGNFTINHYSRLELFPGQARVFYVLDMAEIPTFQAIQEIDRNGDGQVNADEGAAFAAAKRDELRQKLWLALNGAPVDLKPSGAPDVSFPPGQGGLSLLRLTFRLEGPLPTAGQGAITAEYRDDNHSERIGWREIVVQGRDGLQIFDATVSDRDQSDELRSYPQDMLSSPLNQRSARFSFQPAGRQAGPPAAALRQIGAAANDGAFAALITAPQLDLRVILLALATALGLGALHALEPGHGKTVAAAYLVGARATARHAVLLALTITIMHTASVFLLGIITLFAARFIAPERLLPWLALASGLIVIVIGAQMLLSRLRPGATGAHHHHGHDHPHPHDHGHDHAHPHDHDHAHAHSHLPPTLTEARIGWRGVLAIGVSGGLVPCPAGLVVLLSAIGLGRIGFGMLLIVAFSAGLGLVLSGIGLAVLYGGRWMARRQRDLDLLQRLPGAAPFARWLPAFSGLLVIGAGGLLLYNALPLLRIWQL